EFDDIDSYGELKEIIAAEKYLLNNRQQKNKVISQQKLNKGFKHESNMAFHGNKQQTSTQSSTLTPTAGTTSCHD
ncbi:2794_t:CDS:2, partial [Funneliformis geosporum]